MSGAAVLPLPIRSRNELLTVETTVTDETGARVALATGVIVSRGTAEKKQA